MYTVKDRLAKNFHIHKTREKKSLDKWFKAHDVSRVGSLEPAVPYCEDDECPVTEPHREGEFACDADDLPTIIKTKGPRVYAAQARGIKTCKWKDHIFLAKFFHPDVHGSRWMIMQKPLLVQVHRRLRDSH